MADDLYDIAEQIRLPGLTVEVRNYQYPSPFEGRQSRAMHTLSLSLSSRVAYSQASCIDENGRPLHWRNLGDVIFAPAGVQMLWRGAGGDQRRLICCFEPEQFRQWSGLDGRWSEQRIVAGLDVTAPNIKRDLYRLATEVSELDDDAAELVEAIGRLLAVELARYFRQADQPLSVPQGALAGWQLRRITDYVESMIEPAPTIERLAALCEISPRHLRRAFKEATGKTIGGYVRDNRLARASSLLTDTDLAQKEIAYRLGFSSPASFGAAFAKATGMTPRQFRTLHR